jgi:murein DD-endopeptidase MepM/ murein hydrolase activator NlpD
MSVGGVNIDMPTTAGAGIAGTSFWVMRLGVWLITPGFKNATATLDANNDVTETNAADNTGSASFTPVYFIPKFVTPLEGVAHQDWSIGNYVDMNLNPADGEFNDYRGGTFTYNGHNGWDIGPANWKAGDAGIDIRAAAAGVIKQMDDGHYDRNTVGLGQPSNYVVIDHGGGWETHYHHMRRDSIVVAEDRSLRPGRSLD